MKTKSFTTLLTLALGLHLSQAAAQTTAAATPPEGQQWQQNNQNLRLVVPESGHVEITLISPALDPQDYNQPAALKGQESSHYTLLDQSGKVVKQVTVQASDGSSLSSYLLLSDHLDAGEYSLQAQTDRGGPARFGLQLSGASLVKNDDNDAVTPTAPSSAAQHVTTVTAQSSSPDTDKTQKAATPATTDTQATDAPATDVQAPDTQTTDTQTPDTQTPDTQAPDTQPQDNQSQDAAVSPVTVPVPVVTPRSDGAEQTAKTPAVFTETRTPPSVTPAGIQVGSGGEGISLTSVGHDLNWKDGDQNLTLDVTKFGRVTIDLSSPVLDPLSYQRLSAQAGDERYDHRLTRTTYTLSDEQGRVIRQQSFDPSDAPGLPSYLFFNADLPAGQYHFAAQTEGNAKNTFGLLVGGANVNAQTVNFTVQGHDYQTIAAFAPHNDPISVNLYDTDGPDELELRLKNEAGVTPLLVGESRNLNQVQVTVPPAASTTELQGRLPQHARQRSNTIALSAPEQRIAVGPQSSLPVAQATPVQAAPNVTTVKTDVTALTMAAIPQVGTPAQPLPAPVQATPVQAAPEVAITQSKPAKPLVVPVATDTTVKQSLSRLSTVVIDLNTNARGTLVLRQSLPEHTELHPHSVMLDGVEADILKIGQNGDLFFTVPSTAHQISYQLAHEGRLPTIPEPSLARLNGNVLEPIQGNVGNLAYATAQAPEKPQEEERQEGLIRYPKDGAVLSRQTRLEIQFTGPTLPVVKVNGTEVSEKKLGKKAIQNDGSGGRLSYYAVDLQPGVNTIEAGLDRISVRVASEATHIALKPLKLTGDGENESVIQVTVLDKDNLPVHIGAINLNIDGAQPASPNANPSVPGFQLALKDGQGELRLRPQVGGRVSISAFGLDGAQTFRLFQTARRGFAVANGSVSLPLSNFDLDQASLDGRFTAEVPVASGTLRAIGDSQGIQTLSEIQQPRQLLTGDSGAVQQPLSAEGKLAADYEREGFHARYAAGAAVFPLTGTAASGDGAGVSAQLSDHLSVIGTFARVKDTLHQRTTTSQSGIITLEPGVAPGSETVTLTGTQQGEAVSRVLSRGVDYTFQYLTGTIVLTRSEAALAPDWQNVSVQVKYNLQGDTPDSHTAWGAALKYATGHFLPQHDDKTGHEIIAGVMNDGSTTYGVKERYEAPGLRQQLLALFNQGHLVQEQAHGEQQGRAWGVSAISQSQDYQGPNASAEGQAAQVRLRQQLTQTWAVKGMAQYASNSSISAQLPGTGLPLTDQPVLTPTGSDLTLPSFSVPDGATYPQLSDRTYGEVVAEYDHHPLRVGLGLGEGNLSGTSGIAEIGSTGAFGLTLRHLQNFSGHESLTTLTGTAPLGHALSFKAQDALVWSENGMQHNGSVGLTGQYGVSQYDVTYELPGLSGSAGRLSSGVSAEWPLNDRLSIGSKFRVVLTPSLGGTLSTDVRYHRDDTLLTAGLDVASDSGSWTYGLRTNAAISGERFTVQETGQSVFGSVSGHRYALGLAYRGDRLSLLETLRAERGTLALTPGYSTQTDAAYSLKNTDLKGGLGLQTPDFKSYTYDAYAGATQWITRRVGVGIQAGLLGTQDARSYSLGLSATAIPVKGLGLTVGYNYAPDSGPVTPVNLRNGLYLRADALLRE